MTDYTKTTDFAIKDTLTSGDTNKVIKGAEFDVEFNNIATAIATKVDQTNTKNFDTTANLIASTGSYSEGDYLTVSDGGYTYKVASSGATNNHLVTAGSVKLYVLPDQHGFVPLRAMNVTVSDTMTAAESADNVATELQLLLNEGYDVSISGFVHISANVDTNGRQIVGTGKRTSGFFCSTAASGITMTDQGSELHNFTIESDYTAEVLLTVGTGVQGNTSNDLTCSNLLVQNAAVRCLLVKEYSNWGAVECTFKRSGNRTGSAITDSSRATAEIRSVGYMTDCNITGATGWSLLLSYPQDGSWEENKFIFQGGRIHTGAEGLVRFVSYYPNGRQPCIFDGVLWENPGVTGNPGVSYSGVQEAIQAIGPGAEIQIINSRKATMRRATVFLSAQDQGVIKIDKVPPLKAQLLGGSAQCKFANTILARTVTFANGIYVSDPGVLVDNGGTIYAPDPALIPFTTTASFDSNQWVAVDSYREPGTIVADSFPEVASDGTIDDYSAFSELIEVSTKKKQPTITFLNKTFVRSLLDGTSTTSVNKNPSGSTLSLTTTSGEYLTNGSAIEVDTASTTATANINYTFDVEEDLVGRTLMLVAVFAYKQVGATFGSDGNVKATLRIQEVGGTCFPNDSRSENTTIKESIGDGNVTSFYRAVHMFQPITSGTFKATLLYDSRNVSRDDHLLLDSLDLWAVKSSQGGEYLVSQ